MSDEKLLGEMIAFRRYTEQELGELKSDLKQVKNDVKGLGDWKIQITTLAAAVGAAITFLLKHS